MTCMGRERAISYLSGYLEAGEAQKCAIHVSECAVCQRLLDQVSDWVEDVGRELELLDVSLTPSELPVLEDIKDRAQASSHGPASFLHWERGGLIRPIRESRIKPLIANVPHRWWRAAVGIAAILLIISGFFHFGDRQVVSAEGLLRQAEQAMVNSNTIPDRIVRRVWRETVINSVGLMPDGEYRREQWLDNVHNRGALVYYDDQGDLDRGIWTLEDGSVYNYLAVSKTGPRLTITPPNSSIDAEMMNLSADQREMLLSYLKRVRRPAVEIASEGVSHLEREIYEAKSGHFENAVVKMETLSGGRLAYRVTLTFDSNSPAARVRRWEFCQVILDKTFSVIEDRLSGYRSDGLVYESIQTLVDEQVFLPNGKVLPSFTPGPFPPATTTFHVSARDQLSFLLKDAQSSAARKSGMKEPGPFWVRPLPLLKPKSNP